MKYKRCILFPDTGGLCGRDSVVFSESLNGWTSNEVPYLTSSKHANIQQDWLEKPQNSLNLLAVCWNLTLCRYQHLGGTCCLHLQDRWRICIEREVQPVYTRGPTSGRFSYNVYTKERERPTTNIPYAMSGWFQTTRARAVVDLQRLFTL